jgi:hypothetical protein
MAAMVSGGGMTTPTSRVISWNLQSYGKSTLTTRRGQHELLRFLRPDVVCLQEIYAQGADLAELDRLMPSIAEAHGMAAFAVPARHSDCHLAILSPAAMARPRQLADVPWLPADATLLPDVTALLAEPASFAEPD